MKNNSDETKTNTNSLKETEGGAKKNCVVRPTPIDEEVQWDKSKTLMSRTDKFGNIEYANDDFIDVSGYEAYELMSQPHSIIRHPDMPKVVFKILWDNLKTRENFHAIIKNMSKSGKYYWVITNFEIKKDAEDKIIGFVSYRKALPKSIIEESIEPLYKRLLKIEQVNGLEVSEKYFMGYLEDMGVSYYEFVANLLKTYKEEIESVISKEVSKEAEDDKSAEKGGFLSKIVS